MLAVLARDTENGIGSAMAQVTILLDVDRLLLTSLPFCLLLLVLLLWEKRASARIMRAQTSFLIFQ
jgi:hypothetical protein